MTKKKKKKIKYGAIQKVCHLHQTSIRIYRMRGKKPELIALHQRR